MRKISSRPVLFALVLLLAAAPAGLSLAADATTLNVEVIEGDGDDPKLRLTMPIALLTAAVDSIRDGDFGPNMVFEELEDEGFDLKNFWRQIRDGNIDEFFTLESEEANIRAWREDGMFRMTVQAEDSPFDHKDADIEISIPEDLMDYIVDEGEDATPADLLDTLVAHGPMTLVSIQTEDEQVRVWLD